MHNSNAFTSALYRRGVPSPCRGTWAAVLPAALAVAALLTMSTSANTVVNGDFSSNAALFTTFPGYVGGANPAAIDNWIHAGGSNRGINGVGISNPFGPTDKSAATYYGFIQGTGGTLSQTLTLSANTAYDISFLAANRSGNAGAAGRVVVADNSATYYDSGVTVWGTAAFQVVTASFTSPAWIDGTITITLSNDSPGGDNTVSYSDVAIDPTPIGPGSDISDATDQDTPGGDRLNVDQTQLLNLSAGTYNVDDFRLNVIAHTEGGTITPMLLSGTPSSYTTLWVGSALDPTADGDQTVLESGSFTLASATDVYAGFFTASSGSGIIALDANNSDPGNSSSTDHDANGFTAPTGPGQTVDGISHAGLGRTYAFEINVSVDDGGEFAAAGGNSTNDIGGYRIHTFTSSGTFDVTGTGNVEVLVVAGGGGGGYFAGGGGAGGLIYSNAQAVNAGHIPVTVGSGGAGDTDVAGTGANGQSSVFGPLNAFGGGGGGSRIGAPPYSGVNGAGGGSGGGGSPADAAPLGLGGAATNGQGNVGGSELSTGWGGPGGGGAGAAGANASGNTAGNGGDGLAYTISGSSTYYAGGGGGGNWMANPVGAGGLGGGGAGANGNTAGNAATPNTGGGGGGGSLATGGAGGSGIVIVRYLLASDAPSVTNLVASGIGTNSATFNATLEVGSTNADVYVHWGTTDGTNNATAWASNAYVGSWTNVASTNINLSTNGLASGTQYYYTFRATNDATNIWASPSTGFYTHGVPGVDNAGGATGIAAGEATLNGRVVSTGGVALTHVRMYFGDNDGGTTPGNWDTNYVFNAGSITQGVAFSTNVTGLLYGAQYSYRTYASNSYGEAWSDEVTFTTPVPEVFGDALGWSYAAWTGDADSGISSAYTYTAKVTFDDNDDATINGVLFPRDGAAPWSGTGWSVGGTVNPWMGNDGNNLNTGGSEKLANSFIYNGTPRTVQFSGLTADTRYRATFFSVAWENPGAYPNGNRWQDFMSGGDGASINQDAYGDNNGITMSYVFDATAATRDFTIGPSGTDGSFHMYGLANREVPPVPVDLSITNTAAANITATTADLVGTLNTTGSLFDVSVYWSTTDNPNSAAWLADPFALSTPVGTFTNVTGHSVTGSVGSLTGGNTAYYYTMRATNAATNIWASPNAVFYTPYGAEHTPSNLTAQAGVERTIDLTWDESVTHATGFVVEYWKTGGGPTYSLLADAAAGNTTNVTVWGLDHNTEYAFRVAATNGASGDATAFSLSDTATTIPEIDALAGADRRMRITFSSYTGDTLTNFPVLVVFSNGLHGVDYADFEAGGTDLRFTGADGVTPVNYEIENWGSGTDKSYVWVQVPEFSASSVLWAYWGSEKQSHAASQTDGSVWSQGYAGVWHLDETDGVEDLTDSTAFDNDATIDADTDNIDGIIAKAQYFDGDNDYISIPDSPSVSVTGNLTLAAWIKGDDFTTGNPNPIAKGGNASYRFRIDSGGTVFWMLLKDAGPLEVDSVPYSFQTNTWYHMVTRTDFSTQKIRFYINGSQVGTDQDTAKTNITDSPATLLIGNYGAGNAGEDFDGIIDEVRITDGLRSDDWVQASYLTVASNATFNGYEDAQALVPNAPRFLIVDGATNVTDASAFLTASLTSTGGAPTGVWLYWGETNEGDTWGSWDTSSNLGAVVQAPPVPYSTNVTGLTPATQYYYAYRATNSFGTGWLSAPFKTAGKAEVDHGAGAVSQVSYATLNGNLVDTNRSETTVRVYWGPSDGDIDRTAWAHTNDMGLLENGTFSTNTTMDLLYGVTYHYRCYATNAYGETWSAASESFTTLLPREPNGWTTAPWNNDADSGITNDHGYTVAVNLKGPQVPIGGVSFQAHALSGPNYALGGPDNTFVDHVNNVTGDSATMANDFIYGSPRTITVTNLAAGTQYRTTLFGVGFDPVVSRAQLFAATGGDAVIVDENVYGNSNGMRQAYTFMADASGAQQFTVSEMVLGRAFHMYGLANRVVEPLVGIENEDVTDVTESTATFKGTLSATGAVFDVYVYWGNSDGTNNPLAWGDSDLVGSYTNLETVNLSYPVTGLAAGTNYYTFRATNALVDLWAAPSEQFMSLGQPTIENVAASNAIGYAELKGDLTAGGVADVTVYWGPTDEGTDKTAWAHTNLMGQILTGTFSTNTSAGLLYGLTYHYRCYATNSIGHDWADTSASFLTLAHPQSSGWETNRWRDDLTADIDSAHTYNVAVNLNGVAETVNGVNFQAHALSGAAFSISGTVSAFANDANNVVGNSATLANDFIYNGNPRTVAITNLTAGMHYRTTFYGVGFDPPGGRVQTFDAEGDSAVIDEDLYDNNGGMRASYTFRAGTSGAKTYTITPVGAPSFHLYALSNREVPLGEVLEVYNGNATGLGTDSATLNATLHASNAVFDVYVHWGSVDRTNDATGWANSAYVGSYTNIAGQALSHPVAGTLADNTTYYFNFQASNAADSVWGDPRGSFTTLGGAVVSNVPASGVTVASATLNGVLVNGTSADATIYWGLTDRGATAIGWDYTNVIGTVNAGLTFSTSVTVRAGGTYYYRCYATNTFGHDWANETAGFDTPQATLSIADTSVTEGDSGTVDATFGVTLSAASVSNVTVNFAAASGTATVGSDLVVTGGVLTIASGLTAGQIVVPVVGDTEEEQLSEAFVVNLSGSAGATILDGQATGTIEDDDLGMENARYRMKVTFSGYNKAETLTNFPALVMFGTNLSNFGYDQFESATAGDLRFGNASETRFLDYEIEKWNTVGQSYVWVRIPELVDSSTYVWAYWGNEADTNAPPSTTNGSVWASTFETVWHLGSAGGIEDLTDATVNGLDLTDNGDSVNTTAKIGDGQYLDGTADYLTGSCPAALAGNVEFTVSWWIKHSTQPSRIWAMDFGVRGGGAYHALINTDGGTQLGVWGGAQNQPNIAAYRDTWLHMTTVHGAGNTLKTYLDGVEADSDTGVVFNIDAGGGFRLGQRLGDSPYKGDVDEVRLSSAARSPDWVWATWNNQAENTSFCGYGTVIADPRGTTIFLVR